jgi:hypothetical protein
VSYKQTVARLARAIKDYKKKPEIIIISAAIAAGTYVLKLVRDYWPSPVVHELNLSFIKGDYDHLDATARLNVTVILINKGSTPVIVTKLEPVSILRGLKDGVTYVSSAEELQDAHPTFPLRLELHQNVVVTLKHDNLSRFFTAHEDMLEQRPGTIYLGLETEVVDENAKVNERIIPIVEFPKDFDNGVLLQRGFLLRFDPNLFTHEDSFRLPPRDDVTDSKDVTFFISALRRRSH